MSNQDSLYNVNQMDWYVNQALSMMQMYESEEVEKFDVWLNRFEYVADIIGIPGDRMAEFLNKMVNKNLYKRILDINSYVNFNELSYERIIIRYLRYFYPCINDLHRSRFLSRKQYENESIQRFSDNLRKIYSKCNVMYKNDVEEELREQFIYGIRNNNIATFLKKTPKLSFDDMIAMAIEFAKSNDITHYRDQALLKINIYNLERESEFHVWLNKFEYVADLIGVPDEKMIEFFNTMIDNDVHIYVKDTYASNNFYNISYSELIEIYLLYFSPSEVNLHKPRFNCRKQYEGESIEKYACGLRKIYDKCYKENESKLEEELRAQFIYGIRDKDIGKLLSKIPGLPFNETVKKAIEFSKVDLMKYFIDQALLNINTYHPRNKGFFYIWLNKFEYTADIIGIPNNKMIEFFNKMVHKDVHMSVKNTYTSINFCNLPYEKIIEYYLLHFSSFNDFDLHRKRFLCRNQYEQETIENYANSLQKIYNKFYFKACLLEVLCAQFINGIRDEEIRTHLIEAPGLSFDEMVKRAIELEMVINNVKSK